MSFEFTFGPPTGEVDLEGEQLSLIGSFTAAAAEPTLIFRGGAMRAGGGSRDPFPGVDRLTVVITRDQYPRYWHAPSQTWWHQRITQFIDARQAGSDAFRRMNGTSAANLAQAEARPQEFVDDGEYRVVLPFSGVPVGATGLSFTVSYLVEETKNRSGRFVALHRESEVKNVPFRFERDAPIATIWFPAPDVLQSSPVRIAGLVTDPDGTALPASGPGAVKLRIRDDASGRWFDFDAGVFGPGDAFLQLGVAQRPGNPRVGNYSYDWTEPANGGQEYTAHVTVFDQHGNESPETTRSFLVDRDRPVIEFDDDVPIISVGPSVDLSGLVTDDSEVSSATMVISDLVNLQAWDGANGTWVTTGTEQFGIGLTPVAEGARFSYTFSPGPNGSGYYQAVVRATDKAGRKAGRNINFRLFLDDVEPPDAVIFSPSFDGEQFPNGTFTLSGRATDNVTIDTVRIRIVDLGRAQENWDGTAWGPPGQPLSVFATLTPNVHGDRVDWEYQFDAAAAAAAGGSGDYRLVVRPRDDVQESTSPYLRRFEIV